VGQLEANAGRAGVFVYEATDLRLGTGVSSSTGAVWVRTGGRLSVEAALLGQSVELVAGTDLALSARVKGTDGVLLRAGGAVAMTGAGQVEASSATVGDVVVQAVGDIGLSRVLVGHSLNVTSSQGAVFNGLSSDAINVEGESASVVLQAANGVGTSTAALRTAVSTLVASVGHRGGLFIQEATALRIGNALAGGVGLSVGPASVGSVLPRVNNVSVQSTGDLIIEGTVRALGNGDGKVLLSSLKGNVQLLAGVASSSGDIAVQAGGLLSMGGADVSASGLTSQVSLSAVGDIGLGQVRAGASLSISSRDGAILDRRAGDSANLVGENASVTLQAATGVGASDAALRTAVGTLVVGSGGSLFVREETALHIGNTLAGGLGLSAGMAGDGRGVHRGHQCRSPRNRRWCAGRCHGLEPRQRAVASPSRGPDGRWGD